MSAIEMIRTYVDYHITMSRRMWDSIDQISEEQFLADEAYSRGSILNLTVHMASTDRRWLAGLRNLPDVGHVKAEDYPTRAAARELFEDGARDLAQYAGQLDEVQLAENAAGMPSPRWAILLHMVNHATDHRATVLQRLHEAGAPTFEQDFIFWLWNRK